MSKTNIERAQQLGIPFGTASSKLRKILLFDAIKQLGKNTCFKCHAEILMIEDFTIEHKKPWLHVDPKLFWDLDNIAYSHALCNTPDRRHGGTPKRKIGSEGTAWCGSCKKFEPIGNFDKNASHWNGLQKYCRISRPDR